jgi:hypothetical protein
LSALGFVVLYAVLAGAARLFPSSHQTTTILAESLLLWWIIIVIDVKGLLETRAFFFTPFLYVSSLIALSAMLLQTIRPHTHSLLGAIRLPESIDSTPPGHHSDSILTRARHRTVDVIRSWDLDLRRVIIISMTFGTQLGLFIVLLVMKNQWIQYQQPRDGEQSFPVIEIPY